MSILKDIEFGENKKIEFKVEMPQSDKIMKTAVAFSNCAGGKLIIGVDDSGDIKGISDEDIFELPDRITNIIYDGCYPTIIPEIYTESVDDKLVLVVEFYPGNLKPYYIKSKKKANGVYVRIGATNKQADENMIFELERQKRNISFDEEIDYDFELREIYIDKIKEDFKALTTKELDCNKLKNLKLVKTENGHDYVTKGLILLSSNTEVLEYARIKCARFKGIDVAEFIDQKEFEGALYEQVENTMNFVKMYIEKSGTIDDLQRKDKYSIPIVAIREALVNAVVHRDYSILGADIKVAIFDDRIEITSPGALPKSLDINDIKDGRSEVRNKVIARFFKEIGYIEQWGTGIKRILLECKKQGLPEPLFKESGDFFKVTIYKRNDHSMKVTDSAGKVTDSAEKVTDISSDYSYLNETEKSILQYIKENGKIANKEAREITGLKETAVKNLLRKMVENKLINSKGQGRNRHYTIK